MLILLIFFSCIAWAQTVVLTAPWLVAYDSEAQPRWEIRLEKLVRTEEGWMGENADITLFFQGEPTLWVRAPQISADPLGLRWALPNGLTGEGEGLSFSAQKAEWADRLVLENFSAQGQGIEVRAKEARWELGGPLVLLSAEAKVSIWTMCFAYGEYREPWLTAQTVEAHSESLVVQAEYCEIDLRSNRAKFLGVKIARRP